MKYSFPDSITCLLAWTSAQTAWKMYSVYQKNHDVSYWEGVGEGCVHVCIHVRETKMTKHKMETIYAQRLLFSCHVCLCECVHVHACVRASTLK